MPFSSRLKELRTAQKLKQSEISKHLGITIRAYQYYEAGTREPDIRTLCALADYFNVSLDYLCGRSEVK